MAEGVFEDTVEAVESHPYWILGSVAVVVLLIWYMRSKAASAAGQNFTFSYGPSDAQVVAGTNLQIAQSNNQTALAQSALQANAQTSVYSDYFDYLTGNSNNGAKVAINANENKTAQDNLAAQVAETSDYYKFQTAANNNVYSLAATYDANATGLAAVYNTNATKLAMNAGL